MWGAELEADGFKLDTILAGLITRLPTAGSNWPMPERQKWLTCLNDAFILLYKDELPEKDGK